MNRQEIYAQIKKFDVQEEVKKVFGKNFTQVSTVELESFLSKRTNKNKAAETAKTAKAISNKPVNIDNAYEAACLTFLGTLKDLGVLDSLLTKL